MKLQGLTQRLARLVGRYTRVDLRQPIPNSLRLGPLNYGQWSAIMDNIFVACQEWSTIVMFYEIKSLDELLTFDRQKAIARGMQTDNSKLDYRHYKPRLSDHWTPKMELAPMLNRKAAEKLGYETKDQYRKLMDFAGLFLDLRTFVAALKLGEPIAPRHIIEFNQACCQHKFSFLVTLKQ